MKYRQVCLYQLFEEWLVMTKIKHVEIKKEKFMNQTTYELDMIDYYADPTDYFKKCLYLRKMGNQDICMYKNKRIHLSPRLFDALFTMAEDTSKHINLIQFIEKMVRLRITKDKLLPELIKHLKMQDLQVL